MNSLNKFALPLTAALYALTLSTAFGADDYSTQSQAGGNPPAAAMQTAASPSQSAQKVVPAKKTVSKAVVSKNVASGSASVPKTSEAKPGKAAATSPESGGFAQSALNNVDELVRSDTSPKGTPSHGSTSVLATRMAEDLAKANPVKAGTIDEQVYEDGRREERVHTLGGSDYCMTFESPSDPKDGIDKMQYGLHPGGMTNNASIHSCGNRFN